MTFKNKINHQEMYDLYRLCSRTKGGREFRTDYGVTYENL